MHVLYGVSEKLIVKEDPGQYSFINQGCLGVDGMDDKEEMRLTDVCIHGYQGGNHGGYQDGNQCSNRVVTMVVTIVVTMVVTRLVTKVVTMATMSTMASVVFVGGN